MCLCNHVTFVGKHDVCKIFFYLEHMLEYSIPKLIGSVHEVLAALI